MSERVSVWAGSGITHAQIYTRTHACTCGNIHAQTHIHMFKSSVLHTHTPTHSLMRTPCVHWHSHTRKTRQVLQGEACHKIIYVSPLFQSVMKAFNKLRGVAPQTWYLINFVSHIYQRWVCSMSLFDIMASPFTATRYSTSVFIYSHVVSKKRKRKYFFSQSFFLCVCDARPAFLAEELLTAQHLTVVLTCESNE